MQHIRIMAGFLALAALAFLVGFLPAAALAEDGEQVPAQGPAQDEAQGPQDLPESGAAPQELENPPESGAAPQSDDPAADRDEMPGRRIFVLDAPYLIWDDIGPETTPNLNALLDSSGLCNLITRSTVRVRGRSISPDEAAASLAAGYFMLEPAGLTSNATRAMAAEPPAQEEGVIDEPSLADNELSAEKVTFDGGKTLPGTLASAFESNGWGVTAIGCSDLGTRPQRPAATLAANKDGIIPLANTRPGYLLEHVAGAPYGVRTNLDALADMLGQAASSAGTHALFALDSGDLYRAGTFFLSNVAEDAAALHESDEWKDALASFDQTVGIALANMNDNDVLVVYGSLSNTGTRTRQDDAYAPLIIYGSDIQGMLYSPSMRHDGLMSIYDLGATLYSLARIDFPTPDGAAVTVVPDTSMSTADDIIRTLTRDAHFAESLDEAQYPMNVIMFALMGITLACSIVMLAPRLRLPARAVRVMLPVTRILWVAASAYPIATYLIVPLAWDGITALAAIALCLIVTATLTAAALIFGACTRWVYSIMVLMLITVAVLSIDQLTGGNLASIGFLSYQPIRMGRFAGIGNEGAAVLFGSWLVLSGLLLNRFPELGISKAFKTWLFPAMSALIILIIVAPWWGANFGVLVWGTVGAFTAWWMFRGNRLNWKVIALSVVACIGLTFLLILADGLIGSNSHLGAMASSLTNQGIAYLPQIVSNIFALSIATLSYSPFVTVVMVCLWVYLAWLRISKPGPYKVFWERNMYFKASFTASMVIAVIVILIEDSGILLPALIMVYAMAGLTWLVCDLHKWELRVLDDPDHATAEKPIGGFKVKPPKHPTT